MTSQDLVDKMKALAAGLPPGVYVERVRAFIEAYDGTVVQRYLAGRIRTRLQREIYRREREEYPEWIDLGGEGAI